MQKIRTPCTNMRSGHARLVKTIGEDRSNDGNRETPTDKPFVYYTEYEPFHPDLVQMYENVFHFLNEASVSPYELNVVALVTTTSHVYVDEELVKRFPSLKVVCTMSVGYDHIDVRGIQRRGIPVCHVPSVQNETVADHVFMLLLSSARKVVEGDKIVRSPDTNMYPFHQFFALPVSGTTLGIIGMGCIGTEVAKRAVGFGMEVLYHNRKRKSRKEEELVSATYVASLNELLQKSDFIVLLVPGYKENYHLIGQQQFAAMKRTAVFVNVARGFLVDHDALINALTHNKIAHAGLDVTDPEPLPRDHPLLSMSNVTFSPHCGGAVLAIRQKQCHITIQSILSCIQEKPLEYQIRN